MANTHKIPSFVKLDGSRTPNGIPTGIDWEKADFRTDAGKAAIAAALSEYFKELDAQQRKTTRPGHLGLLPVSPDVDINFYTQMQDRGVLSLFRYVDKRGSKNPTYKIGNVAATAVTFRQRKPGEPAEIAKVSDGAPIDITSVTWEGAVGIDDDEKRFDEYTVFEQNVQAVPGRWDDKQASVAAALFPAIGAGINQAWDTDLITTVNAAGAQILEDVGDMYGLPDQPTFGLIYNHRNWNRVVQALRSSLTLPNDNNSAKELQWDIAPVSTRRIPAGTMYLTLPGYDMVDVEWDSLYSEEARDAQRATDAMIWRARHNWAVGNTSQVRRITLV